MTTQDRAPVRTHDVIGEIDQVRAAMARAHDNGRLVAVREASLTPDRRLHVVADLRDPEQDDTDRPVPARPRRWWGTRRGWLIAVQITAGSSRPPPWPRWLGWSCSGCSG